MQMRQRPALAALAAVRELPTAVHDGVASEPAYVNAAGAEAFVVFVDYVRPDAPGRLASGNCAGTRTDSAAFVSSRKRYLGVGGGERMASTRAQGGSEAVLRKALALAEAQGVGRACS